MEGSCQAEQAPGLGLTSFYQNAASAASRQKSSGASLLVGFSGLALRRTNAKGTLHAYTSQMRRYRKEHLSSSYSSKITPMLTLGSPICSFFYLWLYKLTDAFFALTFQFQENKYMQMA